MVNPYIAPHKRIMNFEVGSLVLAMIKCQNQEISPTATNLAKMKDGEPKKNDINIVSKTLESIEDGIFFDKNGPKFKIIKYDEQFSRYQIDNSGFFKLFLETLERYPPADKDIEKSLLKKIEKEEQKFVKFMRKFAEKFNLNDQEWALFELGETISLACAIYLDKLSPTSAFYKLGKFTLKNLDSYKESVNELI